MNSYNFTKNFTPHIIEKSMDNFYHTPVLLQEALQTLDIQENGIYVDATFGGGGHSKAILKELGKNGKLLGFDQDIDTHENIPDDCRFIFVRSNFKYIKNFLKFHGIHKVDGLLADLGVSSHHFDDIDRGFSFRDEGPLDMRMNKESRITAKDIVNNYDAEALTGLFRNFGELKNAYRIACKIVEERSKRTIGTTLDLKAIVLPLLDPRQEKKELSQIFQSLRIEVNNELGSLKKLLEESIEIVRPGGRLVVISYHSLEDRMVKNFLKTGHTDGNSYNDPVYGTKKAPFRSLFTKPVVPGKEEMEMNPRSRSAKMRAGVRI